MKTIDTYIKEAFITKDNIKDLAKNPGATTYQYMFIACPRPGHGREFFKDPFLKHMKEFETYDELINYFSNDYEGLLYTPPVYKYYKAEDSGTRIVKMITKEPGNGKKMIEGLPRKYADDFKVCYKLYLDIRYNTSGNKYTREDFFVGFVNCSVEEMEHKEDEND